MPDANEESIRRTLDQLTPDEFVHIAGHVRGIERRRWESHLPAPESLSRPMRWLLAMLVLGVFFACTRPAAVYRFDSDDIMNLHQGYTAPPAELLRDLIYPFTDFFRPVGAAYYRICFDLFGWNPEAFRVVTLALMAANPGLLYLLARRLTGSAEMSAIAALLFSFHARLQWLYVSNGTVYDILCVSFSLLTVWYYVRTCQESRRWNVKRIATLTLFYLLALNAKEMAAIIPPLLLLFEWLFGPRARFHRNVWIAIALIVLTGAAFWGKTHTVGPFKGNPSYAPQYTVRQFFQNARSLQSEFFYLPARTLSSRQVIFLWAALLTIPVWMRQPLRKALWFSAAFALLGPLPVMFIPYRGFYVMYLPLAGWAIYLSILLVIARDSIIREIRRFRPMGERGWMTARLGLAAGVAFLLACGTRDTGFNMRQTDRMIPVIEDTRTDFLRLNEPLPSHSRSLLLHARFPGDAWGPLMIARLLYRDPDLWLVRPAMLNTPITETAFASYDRVFDFDGQRLTIVAKRTADPARGNALKQPH